MIPLFLGLTLANLAVMSAATWLGLRAHAGSGGGAAGPAADWGQPLHALLRGHILCGAVSALLCCAVHCVVFTYFIATAKWVRHAIAVRRLDEELDRPTRSFKAMAFPAALAAMASAFAAAVLGVLLDARYGVGPGWHGLLAAAALAVNALAAVFEGIAIRRNGRLIDRVLALAGTPARTPSAAD